MLDRSKDLNRYLEVTALEYTELRRVHSTEVIRVELTPEDRLQDLVRAFRMAVQMALAERPVGELR